MFQYSFNNVDAKLKLATSIKRCINVVQGYIDVVSTSGSDVVSTLKIFSKYWKVFRKVLGAQSCLLAVTEKFRNFFNNKEEYAALLIDLSKLFFVFIRIYEQQNLVFDKNYESPKEFSSLTQDVN